MAEMENMKKEEGGYLGVDSGYVVKLIRIEYCP